MLDEIRRSQIITTFGFGSIIDLKNYSGMLKSPDVWDDVFMERIRAENRIYDVRLSALLKVEYFIMPPSKKKKNGLSLPVALFPRMLYCPSCKIMQNINHWMGKQKISPYNIRCHCRTKNGKKGFTKLIPSRFIVICPKGHMDDFPYEKWVHNYEECEKANEPSYSPQFKYSAIGGGASLEDIKITCTRCKKTRSMQNALTPKLHKDYECNGNHPELYNGFPHLESCNANGQHLRFVLRNASGVYYPKIYSSLLIPPYSHQLSQRIELTDEFKTLKNLKSENEILFEQLKTHNYQKWSTLFKVPIDKIQTTVDSLVSPLVGNDLESYKRDEYCALLEGSLSNDPNFKTKDIKVGELQSLGVNRLVSVQRLREIRVLAGFSRVRPFGPDFPVESEDQSQMKVKYCSVAPRRGKEWLPAIEVFGEGIFIKFENNFMEKIQQSNASLLARELILEKNIKSFALESGFYLPTINSRFIALHTLSHLLIKRISFESGYALASLRERIYCNTMHKDSAQIMNGILIYTADSDTEGTLGGLSRLASDKKLMDIIKIGFNEMSWCSSDPVCRESKGQGIGSLNLAACHSCCLLPETCCEYGNKFLDRTTMDLFFNNQH